MILKRAIFLFCILTLGLSNSVSSSVSMTGLTAAPSESYPDGISSLIMNKASQNGSIQADGNSWNPAISEDGRFVVFESQASNLVDGDTNDAADIFVKDYQEGKIVRVSVGSNGEQASKGGQDPDISANGRFVVFASYSADLDPTGNGIGLNIYLHDRDNDENGIFDEQGKIDTIRISEHDQDETNTERANRDPSISGDGCIIAFKSDVINFIPSSQDTNGANDIYVYHCEGEMITRASESEAGQIGNSYSEHPAMSFDGKWVAFASASSNLLPSFLDLNDREDVFLKNLITGEVELISVSTNGEQGNGNSSDAVSSPALSADGRYVAFVSAATNFAPGVSSYTNVYVRDRVKKETSFINHTYDYRSNLSGAQFPDISGDGRFVIFYSGDPNMVPGGDNSWGDVYLHDRDSDMNGIFDEAGKTRNQRVSVTVYGAEGNVFSDHPAISQDGLYVVFPSQANNLVSGDTNQHDDIFVHSCHLSGTPIYLQGDPSTPISVPNYRPEWYNHAYGNYSSDDLVNTMGMWGCNTTCNAMMVNYSTFISGLTFRTDPGLLNEWLRDDEGGYQSNYPNPDSIRRYIKQETLGVADFYYLAPPERIFSDETNRAIEQHICAGNPVRLHLDMGTDDGHFVLVTGVATINGEKTFVIHDPIWGATTLLEKYNNRYKTARFYRSTFSPSLYVSAYSPVHIIITDPLNRKTGYDPSSGLTWQEIPDAFYGEEWITSPDGTSLPSVKYFSVATPLPGAYLIQVIGFDNGPYTIRIDYTAEDGSSIKKEFTGTAYPGSTDIITFMGEGHSIFLPAVRR